MRQVGNQRTKKPWFQLFGWPLVCGTISFFDFNKTFRSFYFPNLFYSWSARPTANWTWILIKCPPGAPGAFCVRGRPFGRVKRERKKQKVRGHQTDTQQESQSINDITISKSTLPSKVEERGGVDAYTDGSIRERRTPAVGHHRQSSVCIYLCCPHLMREFLFCRWRPWLFSRRQWLSFPKMQMIQHSKQPNALAYISSELFRSSSIVATSGTPFVPLWRKK
jgi:hypothetical protein